MRILFACIGVLLVTSTAKAADLRQKYIGQSGCMSDFKSSLNRYGIRLDKNQHARLEAHVFKTETILTIVQYNSDTDQCGIIRDVIESPQAGSSFVWECVDSRNPSAVVVGTWPAKHPSVSGPAVEAWMVDTRELKFIHLNNRVECRAGNYAGPDEGDDLSSWARKRVLNK